MFVLCANSDASGAIPQVELQAIASAAKTATKLIVGIHGLGTTDTQAALFYDPLTVGLEPLVDEGSLFVCLHWSSTFSENDDILTTISDPAEFWAMYSRADVIGRNALLWIVRVALQNGPGIKQVVVIGHSLGGKAACAGLTAIEDAGDMVGVVDYRAVILEGALPHDSLGPAKPYRPSLDLCKYAISFSSHDMVLSQAYRIACALQPDPQAMGVSGPDAATLASTTQIETWDIGPDQIAGKLTDFHSPLCEGVYQRIGKFIQ